MDSGENTYQRINGPFWTLAVEWQFYVLLPFIALGMRYLLGRVIRQGTTLRCFTCIVLCLFGIIIWGLLTRRWGHSWHITPNPPMLVPAALHHILLFFLYGQSGKYLEDFAVGMLLSLCYIWLQMKPDHLISALLTRSSVLAWFLGVAVLVFATFWNSTSYVIPLAPYIGPHAWLAEILFACGYGFCLMGILFGPQTLRWIWETKPLRWIGMLSYGLYIWHEPLYFLFMDRVVPLLHNWPRSDIYSMFFVWLFVVIIPFSWIFYKCVEVPGIKLGAMLTTSPAKAAVVSEGHPLTVAEPADPAHSAHSQLVTATAETRQSGERA
ncbi:hypothetical protein KDI_17520 [Dictyobacter arantiisoli]|uniref:Acyltransferase 3 domain-containing protein n=2 Tax=Dictyobacter arantiisoli TaxID=2014874 RepID=A0A5A5T9W7_9CHLR|nr:hypothetical protein KDI_17520 [Dictyobacter arantiisoli]